MTVTRTEHYLQVLELDIAAKQYQSLGRCERPNQS